LNHLDPQWRSPTKAQVGAADRALHFAQVDFEKASRAIEHFGAENLRFKVYVEFEGRTKEEVMAFEPHVVCAIAKAVETVLHRNKETTALTVIKTLRSRRDDAREDFDRLTAGNAGRRR